jgi:hypothetical protein
VTRRVVAMLVWPPLLFKTSHRFEKFLIPLILGHQHCWFHLNRLMLPGDSSQITCKLLKHSIIYFILLISIDLLYISITVHEHL